MQFPNFSLESELLKRYTFVSGIDEVGRGCLAGPVVACIVVITDEAQYIPRTVRDSKTLSEVQRESMAKALSEILPYHGIGSATAEEIDTVGIRRATYLAMLRAYWQLPITPNIVLMDGKSATIPILGKTYQYDHGDTYHYSIAAASILAKVYRDTYMASLSSVYPRYHFEKHKGYGTKDHYYALQSYGLTPLHRKTFIHES